MKPMSMLQVQVNDFCSFKDQLPSLALLDVEKEMLNDLDASKIIEKFAADD